MTNTKKLYKLSSVMKILMVLRIISGFYNYSQGFMSTKIAVIAKGWCCLFPVLQIIFYVYHVWLSAAHELDADIILALLTADNLCHLFGSAITRERYLLNYLNKLTTIDATMKWQKPRDTDSVVVVFVANVLYYFVIVIGYALIFPLVLMFPFIHMFGLFHIFLALGSSPKLIIFESLWKRMRLLRTWTEKQQDTNRIKVWRKSLHAYKNLLDNVADTNRVVKLIMLLEMPVVTFRLLHNSYYFTLKLMHMDSIMNKFNVGVAIYEYICTLACGFAPGILLELVSCEYEKIKARLAEDILFKSDASSRRMLYETMEYLEERPPRYTLCRVLPLNASLLTGAISLCITYTIVLLQFKE